MSFNAGGGEPGGLNDSPRFLVWGDVIDDIVVHPHGPVRPDTDVTASIERREGGSAANVAAWLGSMGVQAARVCFVGRVAAEDLARHEATLARFGVQARLIADSERPTGTIIVLVQGENRTMLTERGASLALLPSDIGDELLQGINVMHYTGYSVFNVGGRGVQGFPALTARARRAGAVVSVDPSSAGYLADFGPERFLRAIDGIDVLLPNREEARTLTGESDPSAAARALGDRFPLVAVTAGSDAVLLVERGKLVEIPVETAASVVDPTGAGDAFSAGFLASWASSGDALSAVGAALRLATRALSRTGARPAE